MRGRSVVLVLLIGLTVSGSAWARDMALVSNKTNGINGLALADLTKACKGETAHWQDGKPVRVVMRKPSLAEMNLVLEKVYGVTGSEAAQMIAAAMPSEYMPRIWGADKPAEGPVYDSEAQLRFVLDLLMRYWNGIARGIAEGKPARCPLIIKPPVDLWRTIADDRHYQTAVQPVTQPEQNSTNAVRR